MTLSSFQIIRILGIDPTSKGFGFVVLEWPIGLIDWGARHAIQDKNKRCLQKLDDLITRYQPDILALEDTAAPGSRRYPRVCHLLEAIRNMAAARGLRTIPIARRRVQSSFSNKGPATKYEIAVTLAGLFPELAPYLPPARKLGDSEKDRMRIFDALAFGYVAFGIVSESNPALPTSS